MSYTLDDFTRDRAELAAARDAETNTYPGDTFQDRLVAQYIHLCGRPDPRGAATTGKDQQ